MAKTKLSSIFSSFKVKDISIGALVLIFTAMIVSSVVWTDQSEFFHASSFSQPNELEELKQKIEKLEKEINNCNKSVKSSLK